MNPHRTNPENGNLLVFNAVEYNAIYEYARCIWDYYLDSQITYDEGMVHYNDYLTPPGDCLYTRARHLTKSTAISAKYFWIFSPRTTNDKKPFSVELSPIATTLEARARRGTPCRELRGTSSVSRGGLAQSRGDGEAVSPRAVARGTCSSVSAASKGQAGRPEAGLSLLSACRARRDTGRRSPRRGAAGTRRQRGSRPPRPGSQRR